MPDPQGSPDSDKVLRVALYAFIAGIVIMAMKFGVYLFTNSAAVFADALESTINVAAAAFAMFSVWLANRPADKNHPYGHGKIEFLAVGLEGWMILVAGVLIVYEAGKRLLPGATAEPRQLYWGSWMLGVIGVLCAALAAYVYFAGRRHNSPTLKADGKHLLTDVLSTIGGMLGLLLVHYTGLTWLDPIIALLFAGIVLYTSWRLLWQSIHGLMDQMDPADDTAIRVLLDNEVHAGTISGYHKVRHRHSGAFHWVDLHLQVPGDMTVRESHDLASSIERKIEALLGEADATAHVEPDGPPGAKPVMAAVDGAASTASARPVVSIAPPLAAPFNAEPGTVDLMIDLEPAPAVPAKIGPTPSATVALGTPVNLSPPLISEPAAVPKPVTIAVAQPAPPPTPITLSTTNPPAGVSTAAPAPASASPPPPPTQAKPDATVSVFTTPPPATDRTIRASEIQEP